MIYGYARVCSESDMHGRESEVQLFQDRKERDEIMWEDYSESFDAIEAAGSIEEIDCNENPKMTKEEFMKELSDSKDVNHEVFGLIQASDFHVQFEPFNKTF